MKKKSLVIATPLYPPEPGGPATYARNLELGLPHRGFDSVLVCFSSVRKFPKVIRHILYWWRLVRALGKADIALALDPVSVGLPTLLASLITRKPYVVKVVGDYAWEQGTQRFGVTATLDDFIRTHHVPFPVKFLRFIQTLVAKQARCVIVPSEYLAGVVETWGIPSAKIEVVHNGIALPEQLPSFSSPYAFLAVSAGRRVPWKKFEAFEAVVEKHAGEGWGSVIASGLPREEVLARIKAGNVFVLNSTYEGLSHLLIEAMMLGVPVVATAVGGNVTLIQDGVTGLLVPSGDDEALDRALKDIALHPEKARVRAAHAKEFIKDFSVDRMTERTATLLSMLTS
jgi:glycosyltransferase involved in cell wall biosynthesis